MKTSLTPSKFANFAAIGVLSLAALSSLSYAADTPPPPPPMPGMSKHEMGKHGHMQEYMLKMMQERQAKALDGLELTNEQKASANDVLNKATDARMKAAEKHRQEMQEQHQQSRQQLIAIMGEEKFKVFEAKLHKGHPRWKKHKDGMMYGGPDAKSQPAK